MPEQVRVVSLLPDEHEMGRGHEVRDERASLRRTRKGIGAHAVPAAVIVVAAVLPQLHVLLETDVGER